MNTVSQAITSWRTSIESMDFMKRSDTSTVHGVLQGVADRWEEKHAREQAKVREFGDGLAANFRELEALVANLPRRPWKLGRADVICPSQVDRCERRRESVQQV